MRTRMLAAASLLMAWAAAPVAAGEPSVSPQRPSLGFNATTVPRGFLELEAGAAVTDGGAAVPLFFKFGLTDRVELEFGADAVRRVETGNGHLTSVGDVTAGVRGRLGRTAGGASFAAAAFVKVPTARDGAGSGEPDLVAVAIASLPLGSCALDLNLWGTALGRDGGGTSGQVQGVATLSPPPAGPWATFVEAAWQNTTGGEGDGAFVDAGVSFAASPRAVLDLAAGVGFSDGYPEWSATVGWTVLLGRARR